VTNNTILTCRGVVKRFGPVTAVDGVDLDVKRGDILALLGPSGCGKTTLLRMIAGFEMPDAGEIVLDGRMLNGPGRAVPPEQRRVAMVFQDFALFPHMNVAANISFGLPKGVEKQRRVATLLEFVGLPGMEKRMPHELSGGQQQRVALARALASKPELVLLDEPFSNLDPAIRQRVRTEVKDLIHAAGTTAIFVTHDQEEALSLAEVVAVMIGGRIHQVGAPADIYTHPATKAVGAFVGDANFLPGDVRGATVECELGALNVRASFTGPADVMVRSENLIITEDGVPAEIVGLEYFGHDQMASVRLNSGRLLKVRLLSAPRLAIGSRVGVAVTGDVLAFPLTT
jgi:iron(III) transport system ATP-binding protein